MEKEKNLENQKIYLGKLLESFEKKQHELIDRSDRQRELLSRKCSQKWPTKKREKLERRLHETKRDLEQALELINQVQLQIKTLG